MNKLRVWWIPQVPMTKTFNVPVDTVHEAVDLMDILADYDNFQFENNIKPDYCNTGGVEMLDDSGDWVDWDVDDPILGYYDDPREYIEAGLDYLEQN